MKADERATKRRPGGGWRRAISSLAAMDIAETERIWNALARINERVCELEQSAGTGCEAASEDRSLLATTSLYEGKQK